MKYVVTRFGAGLALALGLVACSDDIEPDREGEPLDGAVTDLNDQGIAVWDARADQPDMAASADAGWPEDGSLMDAELSDGSLPDAQTADGGPDEHLDAQAPDPDADTGQTQDAEPEGTDLRWPEDAAQESDAEPADDSGAGDEDAEVAQDTAYVRGQAFAAQEGLPVTVRAAGVSTQTDDRGHFELGPLPTGRLAVQFSAPAHETEHVAVSLEIDERQDLSEPVRLYRGERITREIPDNYYWLPGEAHLMWAHGEQLRAWARGDAEPRTLMDRGYELFVGIGPEQSSVVVRERGEQGRAGDLRWLALDGSRSFVLFEQAQPWIRWLDERRALGLTHTEDGLSRLEYVTLGARPSLVATQVPWLLLVDLAGGRVAYGSGRGAQADVYVAELREDGAQSRQVSVEGAGAAHGWLLGSPTGEGVLWIDENNALWRYEPGAEAERLLHSVLASPQPRALRDGRLLFWREAGEGEGRSLWLFDGLRERQLLESAEGATLTMQGEVGYVMVPRQGLWTFDLSDLPREGPVGRLLIPGRSGHWLFSGQDLFVLMDGEAWVYRAGAAPHAYGVDGLSALSLAPSGATVFQAQRERFLWLPADQSASPVPFGQGVPQPLRLISPDRLALYHPNEGGWARTEMPPSAPAQTLVYDPPVEALGSFLEGDRFSEIFGDEDELRIVDAHTGERVRWAWQAQPLRLGNLGQYAAYVSDRGLFLVERP